MLEEVSDGSDSELADFEKLVDLVISEHAKLEFTPDPNGLLVFGLLLACAVAVGTVPRLFGVSEELSFNVFLGVVVAILLGYLPVLYKRFLSLQRQRRTCQELAELVRETAPVFMPSMSLIRRAELKIRLSNIGIYDSLKYR